MTPFYSPVQDGRMATISIGVLGAARIAPNALIKPARRVDGVEVTAIAARDRTRAEAFARKHGIPTVHDGYDALVADPAVDAVYNPLPNGLHGRWTIAALEAGKHVLCEKPFAANADEAEAVAAVAQGSGRVVMEAFHYRYHPLVDRMLGIIRSGELGAVRRIETWMVAPVPSRRDIRWQLDLAGGSMMDMGCYTVHLLRTLAGEEPEVVGASARERAPGVDRWLRADVRFASGVTGRVTASMLAARIALGARVEGSRGEFRVLNPYAPHYFSRLTVRSGGRKRTEARPSRDPTYLFQLRAFADAVLHGKSILTGPTDSVANMRVIDAAYRAAGLEPRRTTA
jgi:predicted dehydrogenase